MRKFPKTNQIYKHFKGGHYKIITLATHTETGEKMVVYQALYGEYGIFVRPLSMFMEEVDRNKYPYVEQKMRFQLVEEIFLTDNSLTNFKINASCQEEGSGNQEEVTLDPLLEAYLDASSSRERLDILQKLHDRLTDDMITTMAIVNDFDIPEGHIEERYEALKTCLILRGRAERDFRN